MPLITDLPNIVANLPAHKRARFERLMRLDASQGECVIPDTMREWTLKHFGSIEAVQHQDILRVTNLWTWEGAVYNPIRGMRPVEMTTDDRRPTTNQPPSAVGRPSSPQSDDVFAEPLKTTAADAFEASFSNTASATAEHVAATADTSAKLREGMIAKRILDGVVQNKYNNNPGKLAAWLSASHVEKAPKKKAPPTP